MHRADVRVYVDEGMRIGTIEHAAQGGARSKGREDNRGGEPPTGQPRRKGGPDAPRRPSLSSGVVRHGNHAPGDDHLEVFAVELGTDLRQERIVSKRNPLLKVAYNDRRISAGGIATQNGKKCGRDSARRKDTTSARGHPHVPPGTREGSGGAGEKEKMGHSPPLGSHESATTWRMRRLRVETVLIGATKVRSISLATAHGVTRDRNGCLHGVSFETWQFDDQPVFRRPCIHGNVAVLWWGRMREEGFIRRSGSAVLA